MENKEDWKKRLEGPVDRLAAEQNISKTTATALVNMKWLIDNRPDFQLDLDRGEVHLNGGDAIGLDLLTSTEFQYQAEALRRRS
ncbi:hypothetical protein [Streptomyces abyssalis]|nr:hypothetical protein [Streptomyces abyssalis]